MGPFMWATVIGGGLGALIATSTGVYYAITGRKKVGR